MKKIIIALIAISAAFFSCKKDPTPTPPVPDTTPYMSYTPNSTWNYAVTNNVTATSLNYTITSTNTDNTINGRTYHVYTNSTGSANEYYNLTGNDYYTFRNLPASLGGSPVENIYLKDNIAVGASWSQSYDVNASGVTLTVKIINTITAKGTLTVNSIAYTDVIHVTTTLQVSAFGIPLPAGAVTTDIQSYYARKFGLVQSKNKIVVNYAGINQTVDEQTILKSADIK
jgi:hypothetical protein